MVVCNIFSGGVIMSTHPEWATKHKRKGTELRHINGKYYLYEVSSKWNPTLKRSQKITGKLLGKITEKDGFVESSKALLRKEKLVPNNIVVKEYGFTAFIDSYLSEYKQLLEKHFPQYWQSMIALAFSRLVHHSPLKNVEFHYKTSYLSEMYPNEDLSAKTLSYTLKQIGFQRDKIVDFFREFNFADDHILFDGTDLISNSKKMDINKFSKTKDGTFDFVANIMFVYSINLQLPIYYRLLPGNIKDIKAFKLCLQESGIKDAVVIADKGFYSQKNLDELRNAGFNFILPLRRNNHMISFNHINKYLENDECNYFKYENRIIWYVKSKIGDETLCLYLDEELRVNEIKDYLSRIDSLPEKFSKEGFQKKAQGFGTIALLHNTDKSAEEIFIDYKSRSNIEIMIDTLKNILESDHSYMQNEQTLEGWMFINHIALHWYYKILQILKNKNLNKKFSPMDLIMFLKEIKKVKINNEWYTAEITKKTEELLKIVNVHIT